MILDTMHNCVSKYMVDANAQEVGKYRAMYAVLKQEQANATYVYDKLLGNQVRKSFRFILFKEN